MIFLRSFASGSFSIHPNNPLIIFLYLKSQEIFKKEYGSYVLKNEVATHLVKHTFCFYKLNAIKHRYYCQNRKLDILDMKINIIEFPFNSSTSFVFINALLSGTIWVSAPLCKGRTFGTLSSICGIGLFISNI